MAGAKFIRKNGKLINANTMPAKKKVRKGSDEPHWPIYAMELNFETKYIAALFVKAVAVGKRFPKDCCRPWKWLHDELEFIWSKMDRWIHGREVRGYGTVFDGRLLSHVEEMRSYAYGTRHNLPISIIRILRDDQVPTSER